MIVDKTERKIVYEPRSKKLYRQMYDKECVKWMNVKKAEGLTACKVQFCDARIEIEKLMHQRRS